MTWLRISEEEWGYREGDFLIDPSTNLILEIIIAHKGKPDDSTDPSSLYLRAIKILDKMGPGEIFLQVTMTLTPEQVKGFKYVSKEDIGQYLAKEDFERMESYQR